MYTHIYIYITIYYSIPVSHEISPQVVITNAGGMPMRPCPQAVAAFKDFLFVSSRGSENGSEWGFWKNHRLQ